MSRLEDGTAAVDLEAVGAARAVVRRVGVEQRLLGLDGQAEQELVATAFTVVGLAAAAGDDQVVGAGERRAEAVVVRLVALGEVVAGVVAVEDRGGAVGADDEDLRVGEVEGSAFRLVVAIRICRSVIAMA